MPVRKQTIKQQIDAIRRALPRRDEATGMIYARRDQLRKRYTTITVFGLFVSDEDTFLVRPHIFDKGNWTPQEWESWLADHYGKILREFILPGMSDRTDGKFWRLYRIIGWAPNDRSSVIRATTHTRRNKTKRQGR